MTLSCYGFGVSVGRVPPPAEPPEAELFVEMYSSLLIPGILWYPESLEN